MDHVVCTTLGLRSGGFAYTTDVFQLDDAAFTLLDGVSTWVVAALRREAHGSHAHLDRVLGWIDRLRPRNAYLTHMNESMDYAALCASLPPGVMPAHDGLVLEITE